MIRISLILLLSLVATVSTGRAGWGQDQKDQAPPKIYLDRSPRIIEYQLKRLSNERLLQVDRRTDDPKFAPVYRAILVREGMPLQQRSEALAALVKIHQSDPVKELVAILESMKGETLPQRATADTLVQLLLKQPVDLLVSNRPALRQATETENPVLRTASQAALIQSGEDANGPSQPGPALELDWLTAIPLVPSAATRNSLRGSVVKRLDSPSVDVQRAAIIALQAMSENRADTFQQVAARVSQPELAAAVYRTLLSVPVDERDAATSRELVGALVEMAEQTPAKDRTSDPFIDAMQLVDQLMVAVPVEKARQYRERLDEVTVRLVRIATIEDEMRYDRPWFAVQAGRPVQIVLENDDLMAHNLLIVKPGTLQEVAEAGLAAGPNNGYQGKPYVPENENVLFASGLIPAFQKEVLTFTAPDEEGEYPFVCTFPQHWSRMYGVMVVVDDLETWQQKPVPPKDPIGSNRSFVQDWKMDDFQGNLERGLEGRSMKIGERIFKEATCAQCHQLAGVGGKVGPALDEVFAKYQGDPSAVLQEILEPSNRIEEKYSVHMILTVDGLTITGIIQREDDNQVVLLDNPESEEPTTVAREEIEEMVKTSKSIMPKALVNQFTKDEILEMLAYLKTSQAESESPGK